MFFYFYLTSDISKSSWKYNSQNDEENGDASPRTFSGKILFCKIRRMVSRFCGTQGALQVVSHWQKRGIWRGVLKGAPETVKKSWLELPSNLGIQVTCVGVTSRWKVHSEKYGSLGHFVVSTQWHIFFYCLKFCYCWKLP